MAPRLIIRPSSARHLPHILSVPPPPPAAGRIAPRLRRTDSSSRRRLKNRVVKKVEECGAEKLKMQWTPWECRNLFFSLSSLRSYWISFILLDQLELRRWINRTETEISSFQLSHILPASFKNKQKLKTVF